MTVLDYNLARWGHTARPLAVIGAATAVVTLALVLIRQTIGAQNFVLSSVYMGFAVVHVVLISIAATLLAASLIVTIAVRAATREMEHRDDEWRKPLVLLEIDEPSPQNPPTSDPRDVALNAFTRWFHASIALTTLFAIAWVLLQIFSDSFQRYAALPLWLYYLLGPVTQLLFLTACEMMIVLILIRSWLTASRSEI